MKTNIRYKVLSGRERSAFTLVEMLAVLVILAVMISVSARMFRGGMVGQRLAVAARQLASDMKYAVLTAAKEDLPVEVRVLRFRSVDPPGEAHFRAYQLAVFMGLDVRGEPEYRQLTPVRRFPDGIILAPGADATTVVKLPRRAARNGEFTAFPGCEIVAFNIRPDGRSSLPRQPMPCLTLMEETSASTGGLPSNFWTVAMDADTGFVKLY